MFESAELGAKVSKSEFEEAVPELRVRLLNAQFDLQNADFSVIVLIMGDDRHGCNELVNLLHEWLDARHMRTSFFGRPSDEEAERPPLWRYWRILPQDGQIGLFMGAWALNPVVRRLRGELDEVSFDRVLGHVRRFERAQAADGALVLKFWLHLPRDQVRKRLEKAEKKGEVFVGWSREPGVDWDLYDRYDEAKEFSARYIRETDAEYARWNIVESTNARHRNLVVARTLLTALEARLERPAASTVPSATKFPPSADILGQTDLGAALDGDEYSQKLVKLQRRVRKLTLRAFEEGVSSVLVFEGWDAAGKGGCIRRMTRAIDAQFYRVFPIAAPSDEEKSRHYLWRFWRRLPRAGTMAIFDRSWYGRVLVERVEGFATVDEWQRAYDEINDFESQIAERGMPVLKFWLHIDPEEQLRRFQAREKTPYKKYKITSDDYRNRERWDDYVGAVNDMITRTSTEHAPWRVIAANDKKHARVSVLEEVCRALKRRLPGKT